LNVLMCLRLLFEEIARGARRTSGGLGGERLLDLVLQAVHEFLLLVGEGLSGELLEHARSFREVGFGNEAFGLVNQCLDIAGVHSVRGLGDGVRGLGDGVRGFGDGVRGFGDGVRGFGDGVRGFGDGVRGFGDGVSGALFASLAVGVMGSFLLQPASPRASAAAQVKRMVFVFIG
jgi:hypothetical protein